ncbi:interleukin-36 receptor antagonist protein-like [Notechis scutatus]|uniref:Interleukin-1 n=1 Tax=Notechis scutatus TaxID=8663 RepID=A0A6J1U897_9SAUR|nr:interleukin-36 receptor antagonist protein-like [Notechis scutatus]
MEIQKNKRYKKSWDEEMKELFQQLRQQQAYYPDLNMSHLKPSKTPHVLEPLRLREPRLFRIWDISQKFLFMVNSMLIANPLDFNSPEVWMAVLPNNALDPRKQPIFMSLTDGSHTLSCTSSSEGQPQLHLVERNIMELYNQNQKFLDFSFYSKMDGSSETCSFESAQFPGWFISTSSEPNKPINLGQKGGTGITLFYFETSERKEKVELVITRII